MKNLIKTNETIISSLKSGSIVVIAILLATLILCSLSLYNGFPLVFNNDSGMYIENAFNHYVASDRPIYYGLFIFFASLAHSLWYVVVVQSFCVAISVYFYFKYFTNSRWKLIWYLSFIMLVSWFMSASFETSWLIADVFTPICILSIGLLLFGIEIKVYDKIIVSILLIISIGMHNSHLYICSILTLLFFVHLLYTRLVLKVSAGISFKRLGNIAGLIVISYLLLGLTHYHFSGNFKSSRGGPIFFISNLIEMGVVDIYLDDNCSTKTYKLCAYKDSLPNNFLWDEKSPIKKTGGWDVNEHEYASIIKDMLMRPKYLSLVVFKSGIYTIKQFFNYDIVDIAKPSKRINTAIELYYNDLYKQNLKSKESHDKFNLAFMNFSQNLLVFSFLTFYFFYLWSSVKSTPQTKTLMVFILLSLFINAGICSVISGVFPRYQTRLIWILPLPIFLHFSNILFLNRRPQ